MSDCVNWHKAINVTGYGSAWYQGRTWRAHRLAWFKAHGPIPAGMYVLHRCDNPACVNVEHLYLGTNADNMADRVKRKRWHLHQMHAPAAKIKVSDVEKIRSLRGSKSQREIGAMFGLTPSAVSNIMTRKNWGDVP